MGNTQLPYTNQINESIRRGANAVKHADALLIMAGAGMGVDSGLPDFRGDKGFWNAYPAIARLGKSFVEMANPVWFHNKPGLAWAFYGHRLNLYRKTIPHRGFYQLLEVAREKPGGYFVFTSNVDGQFQKAGYDENLIEECHGSIQHFQCVRPCSDDIWEARDIVVSVDEETFESFEPLPRCIHCGMTARPNILMFGDWSWIPRRTDMQSERLAMWLRRNAAKRMRMAIIEMGAGEAVATVRNRSESLARRLDAGLIRINPRDFTVSSERDVSIPLGAEEGINGIVNYQTQTP
ncbi:MAG: NAD-dependent deacetylase [Syntrophobacteraceae bacterium]